MDRHCISTVGGMLRASACKLSDVDLASDCGGDQSGAAFLQQLDPALGFGGEGVELRGFEVEEGDYSSLFKNRRNWNLKVRICSQVIAPFVAPASSLSRRSLS